MFKNQPALLSLRGHFHLENKLAVYDPTLPPDYPMEAFPITDERAILVRSQNTVLMDLPSQETLWSISCPALEAALDVERNRLALGAKGWVYLWDLQSGSLIQTLPLGDDIPTALAFDPQGLFLAIAPYANDIHLWRLGEGWSVQSLFSEEYAVYNDCASYKSIAFSPDGQFLADGNFEAGEVWLWQIPDGQLVQQMKPTGGRIQGLAFSPDGQLLVCGEGGGRPIDREMRVWSMQTRQIVQGFLQEDWYPTFRADGKFLASTGPERAWQGSFARLITLWDVATRKKVQQFPAHTVCYPPMSRQKSVKNKSELSLMKRLTKLMLDNTPVQVFDMPKIDANVLDCRTGNSPSIRSQPD